MELYILDDNFIRLAIVDQYESLIWTERFNAIGDFELLIAFEFVPRELTTEGAYLGLSESDRVMVVETTERITGDDGTYKVKVTGRSLEMIFKQRLNKIFTGDITTDAFKKVDLSAPFQDSLRALVNSILITNTIYPADIIPQLQTTQLRPSGSLPFPDYPPGTVYTREIETLGDTIESVCTTYDLGYGLLKDGDTGHLHFDLYTGSDRTSGQGDRNAVIFSKAMDNLASTNEIRSINILKTVAVVAAKKGFGIVYPNDTDEQLVGVKRRVLLVKADDIDLDPGTALDTAIQIRGRQELAKATRVHALDGEVGIADFQYNVDYALGDMVEQRSLTGVSSIFRVVEQIFSSDKEGMKSYPTLQMDLLVDLGTWYAWPFSSFWDDVQGFWGDL